MNDTIFLITATFVSIMVTHTRQDIDIFHVQKLINTIGVTKLTHDEKLNIILVL